MQRIVTVIAASLMALAGAALASENGRSAPAIDSIGVLYDVDAPFGSRGISLSLVRREGGGYAYETYSRGLGLARLVIASDALESTRFDFDGAGLVRPLEYLCRSCDGRKDGLVNIAYDWANLNAVFSDKDKQVEFGLEPRAMDRKAWEIQTMLDLAEKRPLDVEPTLEGGQTEALRRTVGRRGDAEHCRGRTSNRQVPPPAGGLGELSVPLVRKRVGLAAGALGDLSQEKAGNHHRGDRVPVGRGSGPGHARGLAGPVSIGSDAWIRRMAAERGMIEPFAERQVRRLGERAVISYGVSSYGYDVRCANEFKVFTNIHSAVVDPKNFESRSFVSMAGEHCIIPPNSFALARTVEYFRIPRDVLTICLGKSTYARCGIIVNVTPLEPEWEGYVTLEFSNTTPLPAKIYANEGVAQMIFFQAGEVCETSYKDRGGKYQGQTGVTLPKA